MGAQQWRNAQEFLLDLEKANVAYVNVNLLLMSPYSHLFHISMRGLNTHFEYNPNLFAPKIRKEAYLLLGKNMRGQNAPLPLFLQVVLSLYFLSALGRLVSGFTVAYAGMYLLFLLIANLVSMEFWCSFKA